MTDPHAVLEAPLVIEYPFQRTTGPVIGAFFTALRSRRILGIRGVDGRVVCPPTEYDPQTGEPLTEMLDVADRGEVVSWSWVPAARPDEPLDTPHALALVRLDGADTAMVSTVAVASATDMATGLRVRVRWPDEPTGSISDVAVFVPEEVSP